VWLGLPDIAVVPKELRMADPTNGYIRRVLAGLEQLCASLGRYKGVTVNEVIEVYKSQFATKHHERAYPHAKEVCEALGEEQRAKSYNGSLEVNPRRAGEFLTSIVGRRVGSCCLVRAGSTRGVTRWRVERYEQATEEPAQDEAGPETGTTEEM
jgi:hypothetical protein